MKRPLSHSLVSGAFTIVIAGVFLAGAAAQTHKTVKAGLNQIPKKVMAGLEARFPNPEIKKWTREKEGDIVIYDFEFTQGGRKLEADIKEDGSIHNWEQAVEPGSLPEAVRKTVDAKYPAASLEEIMAITAVREGKEELEGYEVVLKTAKGKNVELTVAPDGRIIEEAKAKN